MNIYLPFFFLSLIFHLPRDQKAQEIIQRRFQDDMEDMIEAGFNKSDMELDVAPKPPKDKLLLKDKGHYLVWRLQSLNMEVSTTIPDLEDGNCVFNSLGDQIRTVLNMDAPEDPLVFRLQVVTSFLTNRHLQEFTPTPIDQWIAKYAINKVHVDHLAIQLIANMFKIKIYIYQIFECDGIQEVFPLGLNGVLPHSGEVNILHCSERRFHNGHYLSVKYKQGNYEKFSYIKTD